MMNAIIITICIVTAVIATAGFILNLFIDRWSEEPTKYVIYKRAYKLYKKRRVLSIMGAIKASHESYSLEPFVYSEDFFTKKYPEILTLLQEGETVYTFYHDPVDRESRLTAFRKILKDLEE